MGVKVEALHKLSRKSKQNDWGKRRKKKEIKKLKKLSVLLKVETEEEILTNDTPAVLEEEIKV